MWRGDRISENMILGKYRVLKMIGRGGSCVVYLVEHEVLGQQRVLKCIAKDNPHCRTFLKEVKFLKNNKNRFIPVLYDFDEDKDNYYIVQEYAGVNSLKNLILSKRKSSLNDILEKFIELTEFFEYLHGIKPYPVLYLDLKPEHVFCTDSGVKIIDFGSAVELKESHIEGNCMGTYGFAAPELIAGQAVDERADIYSMGALLFWCLTGETAGADTSEDVCCKLMDYTDDLREIIKCCLENNPKNRYGSMKELREELTLLVCDGRVERASYRIAVVGSQSRIGVTHFCVELVEYLNENNNKCLYQEKNDDAFLHTLCNISADFGEDKGIVYGKNFSGLPKYGKAVVMHDLNYNVIVQDYGCLFDSVVADIRKTDLCIAVGGTKAWEIGYTKRLFEQMETMKDNVKILYVVPDAGKVKILKKYNIYTIPYNPNPFKLNRKTKEFLEKLVSFIYYKKGRGVFLFEKFRKNKEYTGNNWDNGK